MFKLGDRVRLRETSTYYKENTVYNPRNVTGTLIEPRRGAHMKFRAKWDNGNSHSYNEQDLELFDSQKRQCIIFDLDGTLRDPTHRLHLVKNGSRKYDEFNMACGDDPIIKNIHELWNMAKEYASYNNNVDIFIFSGCSDIAEKTTKTWLKEYGIYPDRLWMRPQADTQKDVELKREWLHKIQKEGYEVLFTVDDRQCVVDMWRSEGITCLQCNQWDEDPDVDINTAAACLNIMVGPSGAGKTHWINNKFEVSSELHPVKTGRVVHISSDKIRAALCGDFKDQSKNDEVFAIFHADIKHNLAMGRIVYADATHLNAKARKATVACAPKSCTVNYLIIDRPLTEKITDGGWRNAVFLSDNKTLIQNHDNRFKSSVKSALEGDGDAEIGIVDLRR